MTAPPRRGRPARPKSPRRREVASASQLVAETVAALGLTEELRAHRVLIEWEALVGARIAAHAKPMAITRRTLSVRVSSSAWMNELGMLKQPLLQSLWKALGEPRLFDDLSFELAGRDRTPPIAAPAARPKRPPRRAPTPASSEDRSRILQDTSTVDDAELRDLIAGVRLRHNK